MNRAHVLVIWVAMGIAVRPSSAQQAVSREAPRWGEVPREQLEMARYAPDSSAAAVVLLDYGSVVFEDDLDMVFERRTRIKILTEAGYDRATVTIPFFARNRTQRVTGVKGGTYVAAEGGRIDFHELDGKAIFDEDVDGASRRIRFTLPAVQPGVVIEYQYKVTSTDPGYFPDWAFQEGEPVLWSEYRAEVPEIYRYVSMLQGTLVPDVAEQEPYSREMHWTIDLRDDDAAVGRGGEIVRASARLNGVKYRWVMRDVPALRREPYMTTPNDFRAMVRFELAEIGRPATPIVRIESAHGSADVPVAQVPVKHVMTSWERLSQDLLKSPSFGGQIGDHPAVRDQARTIVADIPDPLRRMQAIYDYVRTTMVWTGRRGVFLEDHLDDALTARSGNGPEIALLLASMLHEAGLEAHPVLISTRDHGRVLSIYPLVSQFNDVLVYVAIDGVGYLLDAKDRLRPHTLLPDEALNGEGFLVRHPEPGWVSIEPAATFGQRRFLHAALDSAGQLTGTIQSSETGYSALASRHALATAERPADFVQHVLLDGLDGAVVDSCAVTNEDALTEPLETEATFSVPAYAQVAGDFIYFNPTALGRLRENPLRLRERTFPVDLNYPLQQFYTVMLELPAGYAVQETPRNVRILLPDSAGVFRRVIEVQAGVLMVQYQLVITRSRFEPDGYQAIRSFFEQIVATEAEQVVLKRSDGSRDGM
jgi:transglutaminase-like putative cysteine protease